MRRWPRAVVTLVATLGISFAVAGGASAFSCPTSPLSELLRDADGAFVGRLDSVRALPAVGGVGRKAFTYRVFQEVKGGLGSRVVVTSATGKGGLEEVYDTDAGLLMSRVDGRWVSSICGQVEPAALLGTADEPKGTAIKIGIGIVIVAIVLAYALRRMRRGTRPELPSTRRTT